MIGLIFTLTGLLTFALLIAWQDSINAIQTIAREVNAAFGHDELIFPDHEP
ncbi:MAG: hypothetical protein ACK528_10945 [Alphaproteobacteria bacterium]|jgi:hypothetical protein